jgi:hypothetical protein
VRGLLAIEPVGIFYRGGSAELTLNAIDQAT